MWKFLTPPAFKPELPQEKVDSTYKSLRWQVFLGIFCKSITTHATYALILRHIKNDLLCFKVCSYLFS